MNFYSSPLIIKSNPHFIGVDPDLHTTATALISHDGKVSRLACLDIPKTKTGTVAVQATLLEFPRVLDNTIGDIPCFSFAVEGQEIAYTASKGANPRDLLMLAQVAGGCYLSIAAFSSLLYPYDAIVAKGCLFPCPSKWKGSVPKHIHQARILARLGWEHGVAGGKTPYSYPTNPPDHFKEIQKGQWKHLIDAIGLAFWARDNYLKLNLNRPIMAPSIA